MLRGTIENFKSEYDQLEVRRFLRKFDPKTRHLILESVGLEKLRYLVGSRSSGIVRLIEFLELEERRNHPGKKMETRLARRRWQVFSGQPYDLERMLDDYMNDQGVFSGVGSYGHLGLLKQRKILFFIAVAGLPDLPDDFVEQALRVAHQRGLFEVGIDSITLKNTHEAFASVDSQAWVDEEHSDRGLALMIDFYAVHIDIEFFPRQAEEALIAHHGGWEAIFYRLSLAGEMLKQHNTL